jgi:hypothetical protein
MIARGKLRLPLLLAVCLWALVWIGPYIIHGQQTVVTVIELSSCALFVALIWFDRRRSDWKVLLCVFFAAFAIPYFVRGDIVSVVQGGLCLWVGYWWFRYARGDDSQTLKVTRVKADGLAGVVKYDAMQLSTVSVEECSEDWIQQFSHVKTDSGGRFALPRRDGQVHYVRVSSPEARTVHLRVELTPDARPLTVRLKRRRASVFQ